MKTYSIDNRIIKELIQRQNYRDDEEVKNWLNETINNNPVSKCLANMAFEMINLSANQIEKHICEELNTRLNLNSVEDAVYWLDQVIGEDNDIIDFLANKISKMIDSPINVSVSKA